MTVIRFETCDRERAFSFLRGHYPSHDVTEEDAVDVLDLVAADVFRIPDPALHGGAILPSKNWPSDGREQGAAVAALKKFHEATMQREKSND